MNDFWFPGHQLYTWHTNIYTGKTPIKLNNKTLLCWIAFDTAESLVRNGNLNWENIFISRQVCEGVFLVSDWRWRALATVGDHGSPALRKYESKLSEKVRKQDSSLASRFLVSSCPDFFQQWSVCSTCQQENPLLYKLLERKLGALCIKSNYF